MLYRYIEGEMCGETFVDMIEPSNQQSMGFLHTWSRLEKPNKQTKTHVLKPYFFWFVLLGTECYS